MALLAAAREQHSLNNNIYSPREMSLLGIGNTGRKVGLSKLFTINRNTQTPLSQTATKQNLS